MGVEQPPGGELPKDADGAKRLQILATEHWSLLATRSLAYTESFSRVSMFFSVLSGAIIALALIAQAGRFGKTLSLTATHVTTRHRIGSFALPTLLAVTFALSVSACGGSGPSASITPSASNRPAGGLVPAQLIGDWSMAPETVNLIMSTDGNPGCPKPVTAATCMVLFTLTSTTYHWTTSLGLDERPGDVVVNQTEIDFFNGPVCGLKLPQGVGRYTWTVTGTVLHFASLGSDPCPRRVWLADQSYSRTNTA